MSVRDPGARTNWLSLPRRDLMKVCDSVISISPQLFKSNLAQVLGKNYAMQASIFASETCLVTKRISAQAFWAPSLQRTFYPVFFPAALVTSTAQWLKMLFMTSSSSAPKYPELGVSAAVGPPQIFTASADAKRRAANTTIEVYFIL